MPTIDDDLIRAITERVTREVVEALSSTTDGRSTDEEPEWPDWDEYAVADEATAPTPQHQEPLRPSPLRMAARGQVSGVIAFTEDGDEITPLHEGMRGNVLPMTAIEDVRGAGFDPRGNDQWFARQRARDQALRRMPAWESVVKAV